MRAIFEPMTPLRNETRWKQKKYRPVLFLLSEKRDQVFPDRKARKMPRGREGERKVGESGWVEKTPTRENRWSKVNTGLIEERKV